MVRARRAAPAIAAASAAVAVLVACGEAPRAGGSDAAAADAAAAYAHADILSRPASGALPARFGVGRPASEADIAALDVDVGPDGAGLPPGGGSVQAGAAIYASRCASCHGLRGEGTPAGSRLVIDPERPGFPDAEGLEEGTKAIGSYWPWATTIFDYTRRAMPLDRPGTLSDDDVYALTAWLLWRNGIVERDALMNAATLPAVVMPAQGRFVPDDRLSVNHVK